MLSGFRVDDNEGFFDQSNKSEFALALKELKRAKTNIAVAEAELATAPSARDVAVERMQVVMEVDSEARCDAVELFEGRFFETSSPPTYVGDEGAGRSETCSFGDEEEWEEELDVKEEEEDVKKEAVVKEEEVDVKEERVVKEEEGDVKKEAVVKEEEEVRVKEEDSAEWLEYRRQ